MGDLPRSRIVQDCKHTSKVLGNNGVMTFMVCTTCGAVSDVKSLRKRVKTKASIDVSPNSSPDYYPG